MIFNPKVSIVIPVYNGSDYLPEAIESALAQSYKNIEVIVVNDGSTDNTEEIALSFGERIKYFSKTNGGVASVLNLAIQKSEGQYISWLSHDDVYYPNKIERQIEEITKIIPEERKKTIIFSHFDIYNTYNNTKVETKRLDNFVTKEPLYTYCMLDIFFSSKLGGCTLLFPRNLFEEIGYFEINQKTIQDYFLFMKFYKSGIRFKYITDILVTSRHHKDQGTLILKPLHIQELTYLYRWAFDLFKEDFQKMPFWQFEHFLNIMKERALDNVYAYMISEWANGDWNIGKPIIWIYWENKEGMNTPDSVRLCWKTIINHNKYDFRIKILTENDVLMYLPKINQNYKQYAQIAHRADYIRFNLLYEFGGIWLDSDTIIFRSLKEIVDKINDFGFVCTGYSHERGKTFPIISFLASKPQNSICLNMIQRIDDLINNQMLKGILQDWDEIGWILSDLIKDKLENVYIYPIEYFYPYRVYDKDNAYFESSNQNAYHLLQETWICSFGQSLANSVRSDNFKKYSEAELLNLDNLIGSLFKIGYNLNPGNQPAKPSNLEHNTEQLDSFYRMVKHATDKKLVRVIILRFFYPLAKLLKKLYLKFSKKGN